MKHARIMTLVLCSLSLGMFGLSQPDQAKTASEQPDSPASHPERESPQIRLGLELKIDPEALRIRLQRSIARGEEVLERNRAALEKLNAGASATEVLGELRLSPTERPSRSAVRVDREKANPDSRAREMPDRAEILKFLQAEFPQLWHNLAPIVENDPRNADRLLGRMAPQIREILYLQKTQPVLASLKTEQMHAGLDFVEAARAYRVVLSNPTANASEREAAHEQLVSLASVRFDVELRAKQYEVDRLENRLSELKASVKNIEDRREREIAQMVTAAERNAERQNRQHRHSQNESVGDSGND